jgi:enoyl-CoA hydratase/carnithine racemase
MGACAMLPRMIGQGRASELLMTGRAMGGEEGERWGFFNRLCEPDALLAEALKLAQDLAAGPTFAHGMTKKMLQQEWNMGVDEGHRGRGPGPGHLHGDQRLPSRLPRLRRQAEAGVRGD